MTEPEPAPDAQPVKKSPKGQQARYAAMQRLMKEHTEEFQKYYQEEAARLGVRTRASQKESRVKRLEKELAAARAELGQ